MTRVRIRIDAVTVSGLDRAGAAALPGRLERAVRRAVERTPTRVGGGTTDASVVRVRVDGRSGIGPDQIGAAVAEAIGAAAHGRGADR
jgi:hypothetical protein